MYSALRATALCAFTTRLCARVQAMPLKRGAAGPSSSKASKKPKVSSSIAPKKVQPAKPEALAVVDIEECAFTAEEASQMRSSLLAWYDANHRVLPWRRNPHSKLGEEALAAAEKEGRTGAPLDLPLNQFIYWVWVCEVMSQQTQVARAAEYFVRWASKWPCVEDLSKASQEEVNDMWAGLGYYRRARYLLDGAKYVVGQLGGTFPHTSKELQKIPGVGTYTGAAIASIACGQRSAVVDGNVIRVLARLRRVGADPRSAAATKLWADLSEALLDPERPGDFNQAMMELGATVCVPNTQPRCQECPINTVCWGYAAQQAYVKAGGDLAAAGAPRVTNYPAKVEKAEKKEVTVAVAVVQLAPPGTPAPTLSSSKFLLVQRPKDGLLAGLWEFPLTTVPVGAKRSELQGAMASYLKPLLGVDVGAVAGRAAAGEEEEEEKSEEEAAAEQERGGGTQDKVNGSTSAAAAAAAAAAVVRLLSRSQLGELVHVFSHIRMALKVEKIVLQGVLEQLPGGGSGGDGGAGEAAGRVQWLGYSELESKGLSSSVRKVLELLKKERAREKGSVLNLLNKGAPGRGKAKGAQGKKQREQQQQQLAEEDVAAAGEEK